MEMKFCRRCGAKLEYLKETAYKCQNGHSLYAEPAPSTGVFFLTPDQHVILAVRQGPVHAGLLDTFGGYLNPGESFEQGAQRELQEELGLQPSDYEPLQYLTSSPSRMPYDGESTPVVAAFFWTRLLTQQPLQAADDVADYQLEPLHRLDLSRLHNDDIRVGIQALQRLFPLSTGGSH